MSLPFNIKKPYSSSSTELQSYLKKLHWNTARFTNQELEGKLIAKMLQYLHNRSLDITFICDFADAICKKQGKSISRDLASITSMLHTLSKKLHKHEIDTTDHTTIGFIIDKTQKIVTGKTFFFS